MRAWFVFALAALLALPACLDPIVGTQCARGYAPCGHKCVPIGSCAIGDGGDDANGDDTSGLDASPAETGAEIDAQTAETAVDREPTPDAGATDDGVDLRDAAGERATGLPDGGDVSADDVPAPPSDTEPAGPDGPENGPGDGESSAVPDGGGVIVEVDGAPGQSDTAVLPDLAGVDLAGVDFAGVDSAGVDLAGVDAIPNDAAVADSSLCLGCQDAGDAEGEETSPLLVDDAGADGTHSPDDSGLILTDADQGDTTGVEAGPLVCADPLVACGDQCVDLTSDPENCGGCSAMCSSGVCLSGGCLVCTSEETVCGQQCINTASDPDNCGGCGIPCASGLCSNNKCEASGTGRVIVIGHDYFRNRPAMNRILGNAVFLWPINPVRMLTYKGDATTTAIAGADGAIAQVASATGRRVERIDVGADQVAAGLTGADVFLIYGQAGAADAKLAQLGQDWSSAMSTFVNRGGTVIVLDGAYAGNTGTVQILSQAALFSIQHNASATNAVCTIAARGDALATGLPKTYRCEQNSVSFTTAESGSSVTSVVETGTPGIPVVIDKLF